MGVQVGFVTPARAVELRAPFELHVPVVYYHRIQCYPAGAPAPSDYTCPGKFEAQLTALIDAGWAAITVDQLADLMKMRRCPLPRTLVVSFDDGALDNYEVAAPILERLGMRGSFFVNPGITGRMTFPQMRDWSRVVMPLAITA